MTDLDSLVVGATCASRAVDTNGVPVTFGMVVDVGVHEDTGAPYVDLLVEVPRREIALDVKYQGAKPKAVGLARMSRLDLTEVDPATVEEPQPSRMEGWARKALHGEALLPGHAFVLGYAATTLLQGARTVNTERHAGTQSIVDEFNEALAAKRAEREERAS